MGRTGLAGRGLLFRWGPNHAVDPIITRWKRDRNGAIVERDNRPVLEVIAVKRKIGLKEWALPGGFIRPFESVEEAMEREFIAKALTSIKLQRDPEAVKNSLKEMFRAGKKPFITTYVPCYCCCFLKPGVDLVLLVTPTTRATRTTPGSKQPW